MDGDPQYPAAHTPKPDNPGDGDGDDCGFSSVSLRDTNANPNPDPNLSPSSDAGPISPPSDPSPTVSSIGLDPFTSPVASPRRLRSTRSLPEVSPELAQLVDSAVNGDAGSLESLKSVVSTDASRSVVDALLVTMGGIDGFDESNGVGINDPPTVMISPQAAVVAAKLMPFFPFEGDFEGFESPRSRIVRGLLAILNACTRNRAMCSKSGLLSALLEAVEKVYESSWDGSLLCECIQLLAGHSLSVANLHSLLELIKNTLRTEWALRLMLALESATGSKEIKGPKSTFEFDGESSGLLGPGESRWPFSYGYAFATWIYIESFADTLNTATAAAAIAAAAAATSGKSSAVSAAAAASALAGEGTTHMPRLFSFISSDNHGVEAYFHGQFLVVDTGGGGGSKGRKSSLHFTHNFKPQRWYFIGLEHSCKQGLMGKSESELRLYVDGKLYESKPFEFPKVAKSLAFCCIGTNPPPTMAGLQRRRRQCPLFAEMGPVYIFKESIGPERMARLASRGGDTLPSFGNSAGLPWLGTNDQVRSLAEESSKLDAEIGSSLHLLYHPNLLSGRFCPDASPAGASGTLRRPAEVLGQVHVAVRLRPAESLWALSYGGPMVLLPLTVSNVQMDNLEPVLGDALLSLATASLAPPAFRILSMATHHPGNNEELCCSHAPEILSRILQYLLQKVSGVGLRKHSGLIDEELVSAVISVCQSQSNHSLKVQLFSTLLLDLKIWSSCNYGLQKKLLSSLADMVFTESSAMRDANALHMLLDGCRQCYWIVREADSVDMFSLHEAHRSVGELNALVDELMVVIELLIGAASSSLVVQDVQSLIGFLVDCSQANQVARVLHLLYRLVVQPNNFRALTFAQSFISSGGIEALLFLLQREAKAGDTNVLGNSSLNSGENTLNASSGLDTGSKECVSIEDHGFSEFEVTDPYEEEPKLGLATTENYRTNDFELETASNGNEGSKSQLESPEQREPVVDTDDPESESNTMFSGNGSTNASLMPNLDRNQFLRSLGGITFSINAESARDNVYNIDDGDGIVVGTLKLLGALVTSGQLKFSLKSGSSSLPVKPVGGGSEDDNSTYGDKVSMLLFALQKAFEAAPNRLMTANVYMALLGATINFSTDDGLSLYDSGHRFENIHLLLVLLRSLPHASRTFQTRALQDLLFLACSHPENRSTLTLMDEWPEWILEVLISNYEAETKQTSSSVSNVEVEDLIHSFLIIMLEHSMRQKDGWKDVESTIHCAEWLSVIGGSSAGEQRMRREESLPIFKRRLLGGLLDFAYRELQVQTQVIAAAAAGVVAEGLSPQEAKAEAENAAQLSVALAENAIVILMLVEDHLRSRGQMFSSLHSADGYVSPTSPTSSATSRSSSLGKIGGNSLDGLGSKSLSLSSDTGGLPLDVLASMADANGQISAAVMERLTAAAAAEPYESVRCAFVSYGSYISDLYEGWKQRSRMWYGVGMPLKKDIFGGGGSGWEVWNSTLEKDTNGIWIELPLVKKSVAMLEALLLDEYGLGGGHAIGGGYGTGMGGMTALYQLLDSDQPFLCMLRMVLASMREDDNGDDNIFRRNISIKDGISEGLNRRSWKVMPTDTNTLSARKPHSGLLWSVLAPILNTPMSESKRQRVLVAACILYAEVWHSIGKDRNPIRKQYLEAILPPYIAVLRRWRPLLAGIHDLTSPDGLNPLIVEDRALAADSLPLEAALSMMSPGWSAAFASPPAAMALAMMAAGSAGAETAIPSKSTPVRHDELIIERKTTRSYSFQRPPDMPNKSPAIPKDRAAAKAVALAAARDLERNAKIGSGRGLSAVAMATSAQRRSARDFERANRWNVSEAIGTAWEECLHLIDSKAAYGKDSSSQSNKFAALLVASLAITRDIQEAEMNRRLQVNVRDRHRQSAGTRSWRKLIHRLMETRGLFGPFGDQLYSPEHVFWKLDFVESSSRMRRFLIRNYKGSDHLGAAADHEDEDVHSNAVELSNMHNSNVPEASFTANLPSNASILLVDAISMEEGNENDEQTETDNLENFVDNQQRSSSASSVTDQTKGPVDSRVSGVSADQTFKRSRSFSSLGYMPSEADEKVLVELSSLMVRPLKILRGVFQVTTKRINFIVEEQVDVSSVEDAPTTASQNIEKDNDRSWLISSLHQIYSRRYLLRRSALELFMVDRSNFFFDFGSIEVRKKAYRAVVQARPPHLNNIYLATQRPEQLLKRTQLMERWARWEISNFEYLMELNTMAGRSYNDITQYPVFPWILADYSSKSLDLSDPSSYRDLSKPVGALNPDRLKKFQERYSSFDDPMIPKFHYGSHYSSAGTVLYYLVRVEPFTTLSIQLQGGKFDHADRLFFDIGATWNGVFEDMSDVKELVPEMFYLPEVLTNVNSIDFGTTQLGEKLDSVNLPPWAENPVDFIHKHRMALESEHVSSHLHEWIDLIFGYKQRGREAVSANNVFFYITYEGAVDIDKITDPVQQRATQDQIAYFGQTPSQLLTAPHMKKRSLTDVLHMQTIFRNPNEIKPYAVPYPDRCNVPAAAIYASEDDVVVVDMNVPAAHVAMHKWQPNTPDGQGTPFLFQHGKALGSSTGGFMRMFKGSTGSGYEDWQFSRALAFAATGIRSSAVVAITCDKEVITGGHADNSVKLISPDGAKTIETASGHCSAVTCLALSADSNYLVTGSRDAMVLLWRIHRASPSQLNSVADASPTSARKPTSPLVGSNFSNSVSEIARKHRIEGPIHVLRGHLGEILCCAVSSDLGITASSSCNAGVLLHSVRRGRLLRRLDVGEANAVCLSSQGVVMTWNKSEKRINTFTVNGLPIATAVLSPLMGTISCIEISLDGENALIGTSSVINDLEKEDASCSGGTNLQQDMLQLNGTDLLSNETSENRIAIPVPSICFLNLHTLQVFHTLVLNKGQDITAVALNKDNTNVLVSTADKQLIVFTDPALSVKVVDLMLRLGGWGGGGLTIDKALNS